MEQFKKAFAWMQRVQEACLFTPWITVEICCQFTPGNHKEDSINGFTCNFMLLDDSSGDRYRAEYHPWYGYKHFSEGAAVVEAFLADKGIRIGNGVSGLAQSELDDIREAVLGRIEDLADARDMTNGLNMPDAATLYEKEIKKYNEILAKLQ